MNLVPRGPVVKSLSFCKTGGYEPGAERPSCRVPGAGRPSCDAERLLTACREATVVNG